MKFFRLALLFVFVSGCQSTGSVTEVLDSTSGLTLVTDSSPVAFARTRGQYSRSARDYLYLAPVEVNERGVREFFLWVGFASTIDRAYLAADDVMPDLLVLEVDGAPMEFALVSWEERLPRLSGRRLYEPPVTPDRVFAARVTLDQLAHIAEDAVDEIRIGTEETANVIYSLWEETEWWPEFLSRAGVR